MPSYKFLSLFAFIGALSFFIVSSAATLTLTKIGVLDTQGNIYTDWYYSGTFPTLFGKAAPSQDVTLVLNSKTSTVKASSTGDWSYPTGLGAGNHTVVISQGTDKLTFNLHLGQTVPTTTTTTTTPATTTQTTASVPNTGIDQIGALLFASGAIMLAAYLYFWGDRSKLAAFEQKVLKD